MNIQAEEKYKSRVNALRVSVRGHYAVIAKRAGVSYATVSSVMLLKFKNDRVIKEAEKLSKQLSKVLTNV